MKELDMTQVRVTRYTGIDHSCTVMHEPTGITVSCALYNSPYMNKREALKQLTIEVNEREAILNET